MQLGDGMHIVHVATELATVIKVGGLGDVTYGLSLELIRMGHDVTIILPKFDSLDLSLVENLQIEPAPFYSFFENQTHSNNIWVGELKEIKLIFIDPTHAHHFFHRENVYGYDDDVSRFLYFSRAVSDYLKEKNIVPDALNLHDWHTAALAFFLKGGKSKVVLNLHNLDYQGRCSPHELPKVGLDMVRDGFQDPNYPEAANLLKGGIVNADAVVTVSPSYLKEIKTPEGGKGLEGIITKYSDKCFGILNGIDPYYWNPETDPHIPVHYLGHKPISIKRMLQIKCNLEPSNAPLIGVIARLVPQKGLDLIKHAIEYLSHGRGQFVLLGSSPVYSIQNEFQRLKEKYENNRNISLTLKHEEDLAHLIFAGSDMLLVPSLFEPCGITQLIAHRYGTVPIVRKTGGLADTVIDHYNGFTFVEPTSAALEKSLNEAITCRENDPVAWKLLIQNGMNSPYDWKESAKSYLKIYS